MATTTVPRPTQNTSSLASTDPTLAAFLEPTFSPSAYLNAVLPDWTSSSSTGTSQSQPQTPLANLTIESQDLLTRLNTQLTRLTTTLNQLTDEILRSGSRLSYEVEILRGDVSNLNDALHTDTEDGLKQEFEHLGIQVPTTTTTATAQDKSHAADSEAADTRNGEGTPASPADSTRQSTSQQHAQQQPEYIKTLHTLTMVRTNLDRVVTVFGDAIDWVLPPSELTARSGIVAVTSPTLSQAANTGGVAGSPAPNPGAQQADLELKGREYADRLRDEIAGLLDDESGLASSAGMASVEAAARRVDELRELLVVWKGTAEERARSKFVEGLAKTVDEARERREGAIT